MTTHQKSIKIHPCKLEKRDLLKLVEIIKETFTDSDINNYFEISANFPETNIRSGNLEDFLNNEELPDKFDRLSIRILGFDQNREIDKNIDLTFYVNFISLNVSGKEKTWVKGKYTVITDFLKEKRPWFWFIYTNIFLVIEGALSIILLITYFSLIFYFLEMNDVIPIVFSTSAFFILIYIFNLVKKRTPYIIITIKNEKGLLKRENISLIISLIGLVIMITSLFIQILKY